MKEKETGGTSEEELERAKALGKLGQVEYERLKEVTQAMQAGECTCNCPMGGASAGQIVIVPRPAPGPSTLHT